MPTDYQIETETVIQWNLTDEPASLYTSYPAVWRRMDKILEAESVTHCNGKITGKSYLIPQNLLTISVRKKPRKANRVSVTTRSGA